MTAQSEVDYRRIAGLYERFDALWRRLQSFYLDSVVGFHYITDHLREEQARARGWGAGDDELDSEAYQDARLFGYEGILPEDFCTSGIHRAKQGEVKARNAVNGENYNTLGRLCLIAFYDFWEDYLRPELVKAKGLYDPSDHDGCLRKHGGHDLWGDIRQLRESIVHHRGIAVDGVASCKIIRWFKPGDKIILDPERMRAIFLSLLVFRNELHGLQFAPHSFVIRP